MAEPVKDAPRLAARHIKDDLVGHERKGPSAAFGGRYGREAVLRYDDGRIKIIEDEARFQAP